MTPGINFIKAFLSALIYNFCLQLLQFAILDPGCLDYDPPPSFRQSSVHIRHVPLLHEGSPRHKKMLRLFRSILLLLHHRLRHFGDISWSVCQQQANRVLLMR